MSNGDYKFMSDAVAIGLSLLLLALLIGGAVLFVLALI